MYIHEQSFDIPIRPGHRRLLPYLEQEVARRSKDSATIRFAISATDDRAYHCETGVIAGLDARRREQLASIFRFRRRGPENTEAFNTVFLVPSGIGSEAGGYAAGPAATLMASVSDTLITHPNAVDASDILDLPANALYVEGSIVARFLMGGIGLEPVRENRVLVVIDSQHAAQFETSAINPVSAARGSGGMNVPRLVTLDPPVMLHSEWAPSGRAAGRVERLEQLLRVLDEERGSYDAVAVATVVHVPFEYHRRYFRSREEMVSPQGGAEAILTHALASLFNVPAAHSPMLESKEVAALSAGIVDPRMAAETISNTFMMGVLKGLQRSPRLVGLETELFGLPRGVMSAEDVSLLVIPDKVIGLPTLAALEQGIPVIAVRENRNILDNDLTMLPWAPGQLHIVENYWEAAGVAVALQVGIDPASVRRPLAQTITELRQAPALAGAILKQTLGEAGR